MNIKQFIIGTTILFTQIVSASDFKDQVERDLQIESYKLQILEIEATVERKIEKRSINPRSIGNWPTIHPSEAVSSIFANSVYSGGEFHIYMWRDENSNVWIEFEPIDASEPFICSNSFDIWQDGEIKVRETDGGALVPVVKVKLVAESGSSFCGKLYKDRLIVKLDQYSVLQESDADFSRDFILYYEFNGGEHTLALGDNIIVTPPPVIIPEEQPEACSEPETSQVDNEPEQPSVDSSMNIHMPYIPYLSSTLWVDLKFSGVNSNGKLSWELKNYGDAELR